jgi:hypothetical protein
MQIKSFLFVVAMVAGCVGTTTAQKENTLFNSYRFTGVWGGSKHQVAQFGDTYSYMNGGHFVAEFGKSLTAGVSHMRLERDTRWGDFDQQEFGLSWYGATLGYGFKSYKAIHPVINVDLARGRARLGSDVDRIFVAQPSAGIEINVFRWLHIAVEGGYRFISGSQIEDLSNSQLSGPFGQATLRFGWSWGRANRRDRDDD